MIYYVIPARRNSKGLPFKNRKLFEYTFNTLSDDDKKKTIVTTDDEYIQDIVEKSNANLLRRSKNLSQDHTSHLLVLEDVINQFGFKEDDIIIYLYLTYPQRTKENIDNALKFFYDKKCRSLLCKKETKVTPYLIMYELSDHRGEKVIDSDLWRRQDYRKCFERSHFIVIFYVGELKNMNDFLWNKETKFFPIDDIIDVDSEKDLENMERIKQWK